jgi:hypothetical protein
MMRRPAECEDDVIGSRGTEHVDGGRWHAKVLSILLALFIFRVSAQLVQRLWPTPLLPPFDAWQSGALPYGMLVAAQVLIIGGVAAIIVKMSRGSLKPRRKIGTALLVLGGLYMTGAIFRVVAGMSFLSNVWFFRAMLPGLFHIVLAGIVLVLGHFHMATRRPSPDLTRPRSQALEDG